MVIYDVAYAPVQDGNWTVKASDDGFKEFSTRNDALRFAIDAALVARKHGDDAAVSIEGADGRWRMFDERAKGLA
jgi:hypothetical protein